MNASKPFWDIILSVKLYKHKKKKNRIKNEKQNNYKILIKITFLYISVVQMVLQWLIPCIESDYMHHEIATFVSFTIDFFYSLKNPQTGKELCFLQQIIEVTACYIHVVNLEFILGWCKYEGSRTDIFQWNNAAV